MHVLQLSISGAVAGYLYNFLPKQKQRQPLLTQYTKHNPASVYFLLQSKELKTNKKIVCTTKNSKQKCTN